jgi:hypothetical protein
MSQSIARAAVEVARACGVTKWKFLPDEGDGRNFGYATKDGTIAVPRPRCIWSLHLWFHECWHVRRGHPGKRSVPKYVAEYECCRFAVEELERRGFPVTDEVRVYTFECLGGYLGQALKHTRGRDRSRKFRTVQRWLYAMMDARPLTKVEVLIARRAWQARLLKDAA